MPSPKSWHPSLRLRILAPAALVAIPALVLLVSMNFDRRRQAETEIREHAQQLALLATVDQERLIEGTRQLLIAMSQSLDIREGNVEGCRWYLHELIGQFNATYNNLGFADLHGRVVCSGLGDPILIDDRGYFKRAIATREFAAGEYAIGRQTGRASLSFAYPVVSGGTLKGVVYAAVDLERLNKALAGSDWPEEADLIITDRNNTIVAKFRDWQRWVGTSLADDPVTKAIGSQSRGNIDFAERGEHELYSFAKIAKPAGTGLTARVFLSKSRAMATANRAMVESLTALGLVSMLVVIGVQAASERLLMRPIGQLTRASRQLAAGDLAARAASSTTIPELNNLGKDFDDMASALEEREAARLRVEMERKVLEQQYHQAQKMDAVGRLAGGIAHDFNNMLTAILGYCELLIDDPEVGEGHRDDIREIEKAGRTAAALTRQLLAFSRRDIVEPIAIDLNDILSGMDRILHRLLGENIRVDCHPASQLDYVKSDRGQLEQVILNLLVNARDSMPQGGRVVIKTRNESRPDGVASAFLAAPPGQYVVLSVADEGCGMTEDVLAHLFEPFFTTKDTGKGTGLGLATVYGIVKHSGGGIEVESAPSRGSVFRIYLPRTDEKPPEQQLAPTAAAPTDALQATILVVEDDAGIRELAQKVLTRYGFSVLAASSGEEARTVCERHDGDIDLLLSDVVMPGMSGPRVAEILTGLRPSMKVIYMSGYTADAIPRHSVMAHDAPFLQKPFTPERLANKILEVLSV